MTTTDYMHKSTVDAELERKRQADRKEHDELLADLYAKVGRPTDPREQPHE